MKNLFPRLFLTALLLSLLLAGCGGQEAPAAAEPQPLGGFGSDHAQGTPLSTQGEDAGSSEDAPEEPLSEAEDDGDIPEEDSFADDPDSGDGTGPYGSSHEGGLYDGDTSDDGRDGLYEEEDPTEDSYDPSPYWWEDEEGAFPYGWSDDTEGYDPYGEEGEFFFPWYLPAARSSSVTLTDPRSVTYIANTNTRRFHAPDCPGVRDIRESNRLLWTGTREELLARGYLPCGICSP